MELGEIQHRLKAPTESKSFDCKAALTLDTSSPDGSDSAMEIVRDMCAMANSGGGVIVLGVDDTPSSGLVVSGMGQTQLASWDATLLGDQIRSKIQPDIGFELRRIPVDNVEVLAIDVKNFDTVPHVCSSGYDRQARVSGDRRLLIPGRFYIRTDAAQTTHVKNYQESVQLFNTVVDRRKSEIAAANADPFAGKACLLIREVGGVTSYGANPVETNLDIVNIGRVTARNAVVRFSTTDDKAISLIYPSLPRDLLVDKPTSYGFRIGRPNSASDIRHIVVTMTWADEKGKDSATYEVEYIPRGDEWQRVIHHDTARLGSVCSAFAGDPTS